MVTKLHPIGNYIYNLENRRLDSPEGCNIERDGCFFGNPERFYSDVVPEKGVRKDYFVFVDEQRVLPSSDLEERLDSDFTIKADDWREILPVIYMIGAGLGISFILMGYSLVN